MFKQRSASVTVLRWTADKLVRAVDPTALVVKNLIKARRQCAFYHRHPEHNHWYNLTWCGECRYLLVGSCKVYFRIVAVDVWLSAIPIWLLPPERNTGSQHSRPCFRRLCRRGTCSNQDLDYFENPHKFDSGTLSGAQWNTFSNYWIKAIKRDWRGVEAFQHHAILNAK